MLQIWLLLGCVAVAACLIAIAGVLRRLAASAVRRREAMEEFYKYANAVYDNAIGDVPGEVGDLLHFMAKHMCGPKYVSITASALLARRNGSENDATGLREALSELSEEQTDHLITAWINSALVSAESSFLFGQHHKEMLYYALSNPPERHQAKDDVTRFASQTHALRVSAGGCEPPMAIPA